jgi:hypothetical protein
MHYRLSRNCYGNGYSSGTGWRGGDNPHSLYTHTLTFTSQFRNNLYIDDSMHCFCYPGSSMRHPDSQWEKRDGQGATLMTTYSS